MCTLNAWKFQFQIDTQTNRLTCVFSILHQLGKEEKAKKNKISNRE